MPPKKADPVNRHYRRLEVIGQGKFGTVYKGLDLATKQLVAIKVLNLDTEQDEVSEVQKEIQFLSQIKSIPNVTHYYGSYLNGHNLWIVMDYCAGGSVRTLLLPGPLEEKFISVIARELLQALQFIHNNGVIHRDIKAANILISKEGRVQLCDFGVAAQLTSTALKRTTMAGTPYWMAPEVITEGATYNVKADIWSFGITIYEMATGNPPYGEKDAVRALQMIAHHEPPRLEGRQYSSLLKEFVAMCLEEKPDLRPLAGDLLHSRFIRAYRQLPTGILKEVIGRYLLWRDKRSSKERLAEQEAEKEKAKRQIEEQRAREKHRRTQDGSQMGDDEDAASCDVKWDFDSLKSAEYIVENDIDVEDVEEKQIVAGLGSGLDGDSTSSGKYYDTGSQRNKTAVMSPGTVTPSHFQPHGKTSGVRSMGKSSTATTAPPKSLLKLFREGSSDEEDEERVNDAVGTISDEDVLVIPPNPSIITSPTTNSQPQSIEIPNMDILEEQGRQKVVEEQNQQSQLQQGQLGQNQQQKLSLQSQSGMHGPSQRHPMSRSKTITTSQPSKLQLAAAANGVIPAHQSSDLRTNKLSPRGSPTHMKPLASTSSQPLLQPINTITANTVGPKAPGPQTAPALSNSDYFFTGGSSEKLNQFGVNTSLAANIPLTMTPVTEKPPAEFSAHMHDEDGTGQLNSAKQRQASVSSGPHSTKVPSLRKSSFSAQLLQPSLQLQQFQQLQQQPSLSESSKLGHYRHLSSHRTVSSSSQLSSSSQSSSHSLSATRAMARLAELHVVDTFDSLLPSSILGEPVDIDSGLDSVIDTDGGANGGEPEPPLPMEDTENMAVEVSVMFGKFRDALDMVVEQLS